MSVYKVIDFHLYWKIADKMQKDKLLDVLVFGAASLDVQIKQKKNIFSPSMASSAFGENI